MGANKKKQANSLQVILLGLRKEDKVRNCVIRERTKTKDIIETSGLLKIRYAGHLARMEKDTRARRMTEWISSITINEEEGDLQGDGEIIWMKGIVRETYAQEWASGN